MRPGFHASQTAEYHRRRGRTDDAHSAYDRAIGHYQASILNNAETLDTADHWIALAHAGRARIALETESWGLAVDQVLASFARKEEAAATAAAGYDSGDQEAGGDDEQ